MENAPETYTKDVTDVSDIDSKIAFELVSNRQRNKLAFSRYCPTLLHYFEDENSISNPESKRFALFCDNESSLTLNIFDRQFSAPVYISDAKTLAEEEVNEFIINAPFFELNSSFSSQVTRAKSWPLAPLKQRTDVVLLFGLGLGHQILPLLKSKEPKCIVIYELDESMFQCSISVADWQYIFETASYTNTIISLQIGKTGSNVYSDLAELKAHFPELNRINLYRHLSYPEMDAVIQDLFDNNGTITLDKHNTRQFLPDLSSQDYIPLRFNGVTGNVNHQLPSETKIKKQYFENLEAFRKYYPEIADVMSIYQPRHWQLIIDPSNQFNLYNHSRNAFFHNDADNEAKEAISRFLSTPYHNSAILGQRVPWKLRDYIHYKAVAKLQNFFAKTQHQSAFIPDKIDSLILIGIGVGSYLTELLAERNIQYLYIFEPNLDCFYASMFTINWVDIFDNARKSGNRIYLNIGGDGSNYFNDVMDQFYRVGAFNIANTYILTTHKSPCLTSIASKLKAQLKVVLTIGDYYDHAKYGISHTYASFKSGHAWLKADLSEYKHHPATSLPVFIVGNGPSLDQCSEFIKEHRQNVIVVSCGTALKPLYHLGITPDFHAEVEQNRSTYYWITQVKDFEYLKKIKLISVNGIHPDTASLFSETFLAFKEGEAATTLMLKSIPEANSIAALTHAYPTVTNLALDWLLYAGFKQFYLLGVDLGYIDVKNHHSKMSSYYNKDGTAIYDYTAVHGDSINVAGNFRPFVQTKIEFDVARQTLEHCLKSKETNVEVYNCNDGAFIKGAVPLQPSHILTFKNQTEVSYLLEDFLKKCCFSFDSLERLYSFEQNYRNNNLNKAVVEWSNLLTNPITDFDSAKVSINKQWDLFKQQSAVPGSIVFYLLYGSASYFLSLMTKILPELSQADPELKSVALQQINTISSVWRDYLNDIACDFLANPFRLDEALKSDSP